MEEDKRQEANGKLFIKNEILKDNGQILEDKR